MIVDMIMPLKVGTILYDQQAETLKRLLLVYFVLIVLPVALVVSH